MEKATMASDEQPDEIVEEPIVEETSLEDEILKDAVKQFDADVFTTLKDDVDKEEQKEALIELMRLDQELGLYDEPKLDHTTPVEEKIEEAPVVDENVLTEPERQFYVDDEMVTHEIENEEYIPSKEDEELNFINTINEDNINDSGEFIIDTFATAEQVKKHNIDETIAQIQEDFKTIDNNSFWRDHIQDDADEDLKKKS
jgi:hypothetical protein